MHRVAYSQAFVQTTKSAIDGADCHQFSLVMSDEKLILAV